MYATDVVSLSIKCHKECFTDPAVKPAATRHMAVHTFEIRDSQLEHNDWRFPNHIKTRPLRELDDDDFLINHKVSNS